MSRSSIASPATRRPDPLPRKAAPVIPSGPAYDSSEPLPRAPRPGRAEDGTLIFEGRWKAVFTPNITPEEMFAGGAFAGAFFWYALSKPPIDPAFLVGGSTC